jgi:hypothetical protein
MNGKIKCGRCIILEDYSVLKNEDNPVIIYSRDEQELEDTVKRKKLDAEKETLQDHSHICET